MLIPSLPPPSPPSPPPLPPIPRDGGNKGGGGRGGGGGGREMSRRLPRVGLQWIIPLRRGTSCLLDLGACRTPQRTVWPCPAWHRHSNDPPSLTHPSHTHTSETGNPELFFFPSPDSTPLTDRTSWHTQEQIQIKIITFAAAGSSS